MTITFNGPDIETTDSGFLVNIEDWSASLARYRGDVCFNNNQSQRNTLLIVKRCSARKQGGKIAG